MLDHLRQIAIFSKTAELGSFRKAATELHLSPSVVSHHIVRLEKELGVALLYRSTRKLSLTTDGEKLLKSAHSMMKSAEEFFRVASNEAPQLIGELRIALPAVMERSKLVSNIGNFAKAHPGVNLQLDFSDARRDLIRDGVDIAIRMGWLRDSSLKARKLYETDRQVVASAGYVKSRQRPSSPKDLADWDWIELSPVGPSQSFKNADGARISIKPTAQIRVSNANAILQLVLNGNGTAALPGYLIEQELAAGKLVHVLPAWEIEAVGVYAVWPSNAPREGLTGQLVSHLVRAQDN